MLSPAVALPAASRSVASVRIFSTDFSHFSRSHTMGVPTAGGPGGRPQLRHELLRRADAAMARLARVPEPFDVEQGRARLSAAFEGRFDG